MNSRYMWVPLARSEPLNLFQMLKKPKRSNSNPWFLIFFEKLVENVTSKINKVSISNCLFVLSNDLFIKCLFYIDLFYAYLLSTYLFDTDKICQTSPKSQLWWFEWERTFWHEFGLETWIWVFPSTKSEPSGFEGERTFLTWHGAYDQFDHVTLTNRWIDNYSSLTLI